MSINIDEFHAKLLASVKCFISLLIDEPIDQKFYALAIYVDPFDGDIGAYANTESSFAQSWTKSRRSTHAGKMELRFNPGDMTFASLVYPASAYSKCFTCLELMSKRIHELSYETDKGLNDDDSLRLLAAACKVACDIESSSELALLNKTTDFKVMVSNHDEHAIAGIERLEYFKSERKLRGFDPYAYPDLDTAWARRKLLPLMKGLSA